MNGLFDTEQSLASNNTVVNAVGDLNDADNLDVTIQVIIVDEKGVTAQGQGLRDEQNPNRWTGKIPVQAGNGLTPGRGMAYAAAIGTGNGGISTYQWHDVVNLT